MSKLETMAYKMQPAGHEEPAPGRKYDADCPHLGGTFVRFLEDVAGDVGEKDYYKAVDMIKDIDVSVDALHALIPLFQERDDFEQATGLFASAVYNKVPDKEIIYDLKLDNIVHNLGYMLAKDKTLINKSKVVSLGDKANGTIINLGETDFAGYAATGPVINYGEASGLGEGARNGVIINYGNAGSIGRSSIDSTTNSHIINYGNAEHLGSECESLMINLNTVQEMARSASRKSVAINYGTTDYLASYSKGTVVTLQSQTRLGTKMLMKRLITDTDIKHNPELAEYLETLKTKFLDDKKDYQFALKAVRDLGPNPHIKIRQDIERILKRSKNE